MMRIPRIMKTFGSVFKPLRKKHRRVNLSDEQKVMICGTPKRKTKKAHSPAKSSVKEQLSYTLKTKEDIDNFIQNFKNKKKKIDEDTDLQIRLALIRKDLQLYYCEQRTKYHNELEQKKRDKKKEKRKNNKKAKEKHKEQKTKIRTEKGGGHSVWMIFTPMGNKR